MMIATAAAASPLSAPASAGTRGGVADEAAGRDRARAAAEAFEAFFLSQVLRHMFAGVKTDGPFGGGHSERMFRGMLNQQYAKTIASAGGIGIADAVYREILKLQEGKPS